LKRLPAEGQTYLCPRLAGTATSGKRGLSAQFNRIIIKARIDPQIVDASTIRQFARLSFHSLRHSFNSVLANAGVNQEMRMRLTGHSNAAVNDDYTRLEMSTLKTAIDQLLPVLTERVDDRPGALSK
jgi:integrase